MLLPYSSDNLVKGSDFSLIFLQYGSKKVMKKDKTYINTAKYINKSVWATQFRDSLGTTCESQLRNTVIDRNDVVCLGF
jgi:hypothetical protein